MINTNTCNMGSSCRKKHNAFQFDLEIILRKMIVVSENFINDVVKKDQTDRQTQTDRQAERQTQRHSHNHHQKPCDLELNRRKISERNLSTNV